MSMISGQVDRLRTAARTYRRLGNHTAESMLLDAADTIWQLRDDLQRANAENAKLRESVKRLMTQRDERLAGAEAENAKLRELVDYMTPIAWYAASEQERDRMRELGVEVTDHDRD